MSKDYPSKLYYTISEVGDITDVKAHVLRYWETEFPTLKPKKTRSGSRRYRQVDIDEILAIKNLLYVEGFKIAGARKMRKQARSKSASPPVKGEPQMALGFDAMDDSAKIEFIKTELRELMVMVKELKNSPGTKADKSPLQEMEQEG